ncbi:hypothetical protein PENSPDRAFT_750505 [Peniophora sp. CONT]|nr:hypothetical protein PENSPDRAFT_750505 [Peniophora sp. CONT]
MMLASSVAYRGHVVIHHQLHPATGRRRVHRQPLSQPIRLIMPSASRLVRKGGNMPLIESEEERRKFPQPGSPTCRQRLVAAVHDFSRLYRASVESMEYDEPLLLSADHLDCSIVHAMPIHEDLELERLLFKSGVHDLYQDIIMAEHFFRQPLFFIDSVITAFVRLVGDLTVLTSRPLHARVFVEPLLLRAPTLWKSIWERRQQLVCSTPQDHQLLPSPKDGPDAVLVEPLLQLLCVYNHLYVANAQKYSAPLSSYIPLVALYHPLSLAAFDVPYQKEKESWREALTCLVESVIDDTARNTLVRSVTLDSETASAADSFFTRLNHGLEAFPEECEAGFERALQRLGTYRRLASSPLTFKWLSTYSIHRSFVRAMSRVLRSSLDAQTVKTIVWLACGGLTGEILQAVIDTVERPGLTLEIYLIGEDLVCEVARAVDLLCQEGLKLEPMRLGRRFEHIVEQRLLDVNRLIVLLKGHGSDDARLFVQSATIGALAEWWPSLRALQTVVYRLPATSPQRAIFAVSHNSGWLSAHYWI